MKFRSFLSTLAVALGLAAPAAYADTHIAAAYGSISVYNAPIWIAKEQGIFKKYGLDVDLVQLTGPRITTGLVANSVQFISSSASSPFLAVLSGGDPLMVGTLLGKDPNDFVVNPKKISTPADVKGKIGGMGFRGDLTEVALRQVLGSYGLNPDKDVQLVQGFAGDPDRISALVTGQVDFTTITADYNNVYTQAGFKLMTRVMDVPNTDFVQSGVFTTASYAKANGPVVTAYLKAMAEALRVFETNKDVTLAAAAKYANRPAADIAPSYDAFRDLMAKTPVITPALVKNSLDAVGLSNPAAKTADVAKFYDASYADKLDKDGTFAAIAKGQGK